MLASSHFPTPESLALPTANSVLPIVKDWINDIGIEAAFKITGIALLYSGPKESIHKALEKKFPRNHEIVMQLIEDNEHYVIDTTEIGTRLNQYEKIGLFGFFEEKYLEAYEKHFSPSFDSSKTEEVYRIIDRQANAVMEFVSEKFIEQIEGEVETCVCGADTSRIFFQIELPALMRSNKVQKINGVDFKKFKDVYDSGRPDAAYETFSMICTSELDMLEKRALDLELNGDLDECSKVWQDHEHRWYFFRLEQADRRGVKNLEAVYGNLKAVDAYEAEFNPFRASPTIPSAPSFRVCAPGLH